MRSLLTRTTDSSLAQGKDAQVQLLKTDLTAFKRQVWQAYTIGKRGKGKAA